MFYLELEQILMLHELAIAETGDEYGIYDYGLLENAYYSLKSRSYT